MSPRLHSPFYRASVSLLGAAGLAIVFGCVTGGSDGDVLTDENPGNVMLAVVAPLGQTIELDVRTDDTEQTLPGCPGLADTTTCHTVLPCPQRIEALRARRLDDQSQVLAVVDMSSVAGSVLLRDTDYACDSGKIVFDLSGDSPSIRVEQSNTR